MKCVSRVGKQHFPVLLQRYVIPHRAANYGSCLCENFFTVNVLSARKALYCELNIHLCKCSSPNLSCSEMFSVKLVEMRRNSRRIDENVRRILRLVRSVLKKCQPFSKSGGECWIASPNKFRATPSSFEKCIYARAACYVCIQCRAFVENWLAGDLALSYNRYDH